MNVMLQARSRTLAIDLNAAITNQEIPLYQLQRFSGESGGEKRSGVVRAILLHAPGDHCPRVGLLNSDLDIRIGFVIAQQDVVTRLVLLDQADKLAGIKLLRVAGEIRAFHQVNLVRAVAKKLLDALYLSAQANGG